MSQDRTDPSVALQLLGVRIPEVEELRALPYPEAITKLEALKERVRKNWRKLAFELHPDRTQNDPEKTRLFQAVTEIRNQFEKLVLPVPVHPAAPARHQVQPNAGPPHTPGVVFRAPRPQPPKPTRPNVGFVTATMKP